MWLWLFPMNVLGWLATGKRIGTFKGVPVHVMLWHPFGHYSMAFGDRIAIHKKNMGRTGDNTHYIINRWHIEHEHVHVTDQIRVGAFVFLVTYAWSYLVNFFNPAGKAFFRFKAAYLAVNWEKRARRRANHLDGQVFFKLDGRSELA